MDIRSKTYAQAIWETMHHKKEQEIFAILNVLEMVESLLRRRGGIMEVTSNPRLSLSNKEDILRQFMAQIKAEKEVINFIILLLRKRQLTLLPSIIKIFKREIYRKFQIVEARVKVPEPLTSEEKSLVDKLIKEVFKAKEVIWQEICDATILAGCSLQIEGIIIDSSLRTKINRIKKSISF